jgi:hypothetical protein
MMPKVTNGRVDQMLTNVALAYTNPNYYADLIFPVVPGLKDDSGDIPQLGNAHLRTYATKRGVYDEGEHRLAFEYSHDQKYNIEYYDLAAYVPDRIAEQSRLPFDVHNAAQFTVLEALKLEREIAAAAALTSTAIITNNQDFTSTSARQYTAGTSTPLKDISDALASVFTKTGREANTLTIERRVANALRAHAEIKAIAIAGLMGGKSKLTELSEAGLVETLKSWFNLENVIIVKGIKVTSKEGQTETTGNTWNPDIVAFYRPAAPTIFAPSFGYSFQLAGYDKRTVVRRNKSDKGDDVEVMWGYQDMIVDANAAYLLKGCVA